MRENGIACLLIRVESGLVMRRLVERRVVLTIDRIMSAIILIITFKFQADYWCKKELITSHNTKIIDFPPCCPSQTSL